MDSIAQTHHRNTLHLSLPHHPSISSKPTSSLSFKSPSKKPLTIKTLNSKPQTLKPLLKSAIATAALLLARFTHPAIAAPITQPTTTTTTTTVESITTSDSTPKRKEKLLNHYLNSNPNDVEALKALLTIKLDHEKYSEVLPIINRLLELQPSETQWRLKKARALARNGYFEPARLIFEELISENHLSADAHYGLVNVAARVSFAELDDILKRVEGVMEKCEKEDKKDDFWEFKFVVAQGRMFQGRYADALKLFEQLIEEQPGDCRPYIHQGMAYILLGKKAEGINSFREFRWLLPKDHEYARRNLLNKIYPRMPKD